LRTSSGSLQIKYFIICLLMTLIASAANIPVNIDNDIYNFLQRMENRGIINGYSGMTLPLNRDEISGFLEQVEKSQAKLNSIEKDLFISYRSHYYLEMGDIESSTLGETKIKFINTGIFTKTACPILSRNPVLREQHFLRYEDKNEFLWIDLDLKGQNQTKNKFNRQILANRILLRGGFHEKLAGFLQFDQYLKLNSEQYAELLPEEKGRFINEDVYFSNAYSGISYNSQWFKAGLYQQPFLWGPSRTNNLTFSNNGPPFPYFELSSQLGWLKYSLIHGGLVNDSTSHKFDNVTREHRDMEKNIAAQRFEISLFDGKTYFALNQMVIYSNRNLEWSYLVPFNLYFAAEHYLEDRDNTLMSLELKTEALKNTEIYTTIFLDELKWAELGKQWWANKHGLQAGLRYHTFLFKHPTDFQFEYTALRPWTYTHKVFNNNYTNDRYCMGFPYGPNSQLLYLNMESYLNYRLKFFLEYNYLQQGQDTKNTVYGGEATANYENRDPRYDHSTNWLMGDILTRNKLELGLNYEYFNDCYLFGSIEYRMDSSSKDRSYFYTNVGISVNL